MDSPLESLLARELGLPVAQVARTLALLDEGATVPFLARYRKEQTGSLDEVQIASIQERAAYLRELSARRKTVLAQIAEQGKLTDELRAAIEAATSKQVLEDLYLPYRPRRRTRATIARERGYEPLALAILEQRNALPAGLSATDEARAGARDIVAELVSERADVRLAVRTLLERDGQLTARVIPGKEGEGKNFADYFEHSEPVARAPSHRVLALRRGEKEGFLRVNLAVDDQAGLAAVR